MGKKIKEQDFLSQDDQLIYDFYDEQGVKDFNNAMEKNKYKNDINSTSIKDVTEYLNHVAFIKESNAIEGINREPTDEELKEHIRFINLTFVTIDDLVKFVSVYEPDAKLRDKKGLNVRVGSYNPPTGGMNIVSKLQDILDDLELNTPFKAHCDYEGLHPFTDGNGRSGRVLWVWQMVNNFNRIPDRFLQDYYYQSLDAYRYRNL